MAVTPLLPAYLRAVADIPAELAPFVVAGVIGGLAIPGLAVMSNLYRGLLMAGRSTPDVYRGMAIHLLIAAGGVSLGVWQQMSGILTAVGALTLATLAETAYLGWRSAAMRARRWPAGTGRSQEMTAR